MEYLMSIPATLSFLNRQSAYPSGRTRISLGVAALISTVTSPAELVRGFKGDLALPNQIFGSSFLIGLPFFPFTNLIVNFPLLATELTCATILDIPRRPSR